MSLNNQIPFLLEYIPQSNLMAVYDLAAEMSVIKFSDVLCVKAITVCRLVDEIVWVKMTVNKRLAKSHGYYLQHAKEVCLVGRKGNLPPNTQSSVASDVIYSERRGQSQKPEEIYQIIEELVPGGRPTPVRILTTSVELKT